MNKIVLGRKQYYLDTIYVIYKGEVCKTDVLAPLFLGDDCEQVIETGTISGLVLSLSSFGKRFFLTRAKAKAALAAKV